MFSGAGESKRCESKTLPPSLGPLGLRKGDRKLADTGVTTNAFPRVSCHVPACPSSEPTLMATSLCPLKLTMTSATSMVRATWQLPTAAGPPASPVIRMGFWSQSSTSISANRSVISGLSRWVPVSPFCCPSTLLLGLRPVCSYGSFSGQICSNRQLEKGTNSPTPQLSRGLRLCWLWGGSTG